MRSVAIAAVLIAYGALAAHATDRRVPSQYGTIQAAIDASNSFDRVLVAPGTYRERLRIRGMWLTIESEQGASVTTIDAEGQGVAVTFDPKAHGGTVLRGFTITGGYVSGATAEGAGVVIDGGTPTLLDNRIIGNRVFGSSRAVGAGIYCTSYAYFVNNEVRENQATGTSRSAVLGGAGIYAEAGLFVTNRIIGNTNVSGSDINTQVPECLGGGAWLNGRVYFVNNLVMGNMSGIVAFRGRGGGLCLERDPLVGFNTIIENAAQSNYGYGGGVYCRPNATPVIESNVIVGNFAQGEWTQDSAEGGGIYVDAGGTPTIAYNTIRSNRVIGRNTRGAGIAVNNAAPTIVGCILWDNKSWLRGSVTGNESIDGVTAGMIRYSLIGDGQFASTNGNFTGDPRFRDAYRLASDSPCIDRGEPTNASVLAPVDAGLGARFVDATGQTVPRIDVGAHEYDTLRRTSRVAIHPGDIVPLVIDVPKLAGQRYLVAASFVATPVQLPNDPRSIPIGFDALVQVSIGQLALPFEGFAGRLDNQGAARPRLEVAMVPALAGIAFHLAAVVLDGSNAIDLVSNRLEVRVDR